MGRGKLHIEISSPRVRVFTQLFHGYFHTMDIFKVNRKSHVETGEIYFWTATINGWKKLLQADEMKMMVIESLQWLKNKELIEVYGYVIMPNHIHLIWEVLRKTAKNLLMVLS